jgi:hypothetical protein
MVEYVLADNPPVLFDPAVGTGVFFKIAKAVANEKGICVRFEGMEIDERILAKSFAHGLTSEELAGVKVGDFLLAPPYREYSAIVANPPYIRHHRLDKERKHNLRRMAAQILGTFLDGRAGLHIYFLIRALTMLTPGGRLAFIMPADTCEGKFAPHLWGWITSNFALDAVLTFAPSASPFPEVDTNPLVFFIRKAPPNDLFAWGQCYRPSVEALVRWVRCQFKESPKDALYTAVRNLKEAVSAGLSRPLVLYENSRFRLGDFVTVRRGVATGANDFFFLTKEKASKLGIPEQYLVQAVGRTRDVPGYELTTETLERLECSGRPTLLLCLPGESLESFPEPVREYLKQGELLGLPSKPLLSTRRPWYKMEKREPPPFLFAYLGRRNSRFIRNEARVVPLTSFLCVYPKPAYEQQVEQIWKILNNPETVRNLATVGKTYGDGAIKVEPRLLERLPIPEHIVENLNLPVQMRLFEETKPYLSGRRGKK